MLFNKSLIVCLLLAVNCLFALNQSNISQTTDLLWNNISGALNQNQIKNITFDIRSENFADLINFKLSNLAIQNNYSVFDTASDSVVTVSVLQDYKIVSKNYNYYLFTRETSKQYPLFLIKLINNNKVVYSQEIIIKDTFTKKNKTSAKWYEPFMLSAVIGSLIYIIYYGNH